MTAEVASLYPKPKEGQEPDFSDKSWRIFYPLYVDSTKSKSDGRKISKDNCCVNPGAEDLFEACAVLKVKAFIELRKAHPKTPIDRIGRVRAKMDNSCIYSTKKELLNAVGKKIPSLPNFEKRKQMKEKKTAELFKSIAGNTPTINPAKAKKKKGKKRR